MIGLSPSEVEVVRATLLDAFGADAEIWLFGSRAHGDRGGDVDLYVESPRPGDLPARLAARRRLESLLHQKVDLIVRGRQEPRSAIDGIARDTGVAL